jgi:hypothetical protein
MMRVSIRLAAAGLLALGVAACASDNTASNAVISDRPMLKATCTLPANDDKRAYDSGVGMVVLTDKQNIEVQGASQDEVRARLAKMGVGTKEHPCLSINVEQMTPGT